MEVSDKCHAPAALPSGKEPQYPLNRRLGGPQSQSKRKILSLSLLELHPSHPAHSLVTILTELSAIFIEKKMDVLRFNRGVKFSNAVSPISNE
jgi:hypothetical protein